MPVDLVYLWVNGSDPIWQAKRNAVIGRTVEHSATNCEGRYANNDELKYSLRSVELYAPWIRKIFIVTDHQVPEWLDTSNPKIKIVDHTEIMPPEALPCFSSTLIEHFLYRIPDLAEHFLYANDDMYINRPVTPDDFFTQEGLPIIRQSRRFFRKLYIEFLGKIRKKKLSHYNHVVHNSALLVERKFGKYYGGKAHHNIDSYLKSQCEHVEELFREEFKPTFVNHVRKPNDFQRSVYSYVALAEGMGCQRYVTQKESLRIHIEKERHYAKLAKYNPMFFCTNDSEYADDEDRKREVRFIKNRFPNPSCFEL